MNNIVYLLNKYPKSICLISGLFSGLVYSPTYLIFLWFGVSLLSTCVYFSKTYKEAFLFGFLFGFGHFLSSIYWVSIAISVYADDFWWFIPIALFGLPLILAFFIAFSTCFARFWRGSRLFSIMFAVFWVIFEYLRSFIFTGFPWNLAGYSLSYSLVLIQITTKISIYGLSFYIIYIFSGFSFYFINKTKEFKRHIFIVLILILIQVFFGIYRVNTYPTQLTNHKVRIIQPSIAQEDKWSQEKLVDNINHHIKLSNINNGFSPDIIVWSESAVPFIINKKEVRKYITEFLTQDQILITGSISESNLTNDSDNKKFVSFNGLNNNGDILFSYEKRHLVPFGEYVPLKNFLAIKKITYGFEDFSKGRSSHIVNAKNLKIRPLICYEAIFPDEVLSTNKDTDLLINITNDSWFGNIGPYQHFDITRMRSVETGLPMIRSANNGISAIIDPIGRVVKTTSLNEIGVLDGYIPHKLQNQLNTNIHNYINLLLIIINIIVLIIL